MSSLHNFCTSASESSYKPSDCIRSTPFVDTVRGVFSTDKANPRRWIPTVLYGAVRCGAVWTFVYGNPTTRCGAEFSFTVRRVAVGFF